MSVDDFLRAGREAMTAKAHVVAMRQGWAPYRFRALVAAVRAVLERAP